MVKHVLKTSAVAILALFVAVPVMAQQGAGQKPDQQAQMQNKRQITGEVLKEKTVKNKSTNTQDKVVLLKTQKGNQIVADLGPAKNLENIKIQSGEQIQLSGKVNRVSNRPVLFAEQVTANGQTVQIQRSDRPKSAKKKMDAAQPQQLSGQVIREKTVNLQGTNTEHEVVMLQTQDGKQVIADLGPVRNLENIKIEPGEQVQVKGNLARVSDQLVLVANQLTADGKTMQIDRPRVRTAPSQSPGSKAGQQ